MHAVTVIEDQVKVAAVKAFVDVVLKNRLVELEGDITEYMVTVPDGSVIHFGATYGPCNYREMNLDSLLYISFVSDEKGTKVRLKFDDRNARWRRVFTNEQAEMFIATIVEPFANKLQCANILG